MDKDNNNLNNNSNTKLNNSIDINTIRNSLQQVCSDVWKNYKSHTEHFNQNNQTEFWENWVDDLSVFDEAYRNDSVKYELYIYLAKGLFEATKRGLNGIT